MMMLAHGMSAESSPANPEAKRIAQEAVRVARAAACPAAEQRGVPPAKPAVPSPKQQQQQRQQQQQQQQGASAAACPGARQRKAPTAVPPQPRPELQQWGTAFAADAAAAADHMAALLLVRAEHGQMLVARRKVPDSHCFFATVAHATVNRDRNSCTQHVGRGGSRGSCQGREAGQQESPKVQEGGQEGGQGCSALTCRTYSGCSRR